MHRLLTTVPCPFKKPHFLQLIESILCKFVFLVTSTLIVNPFTKLLVWGIIRRHIAATVVFLLVGLQSLEHLGPFFVKKMLMVRNMNAIHFLFVLLFVAVVVFLAAGAAAAAAAAETLPTQSVGKILTFADMGQELQKVTQ